MSREILMEEKDIARFWPKVDIKDDADSCWEWNACIGTGGYGLFQLNGQALIAHRIAWVLENKTQVPNDKPFVCHKCDNPKCCRPSHLFAGTPDDNMQDCKRKGRRPSGDASPSRMHPERCARGKRHGSHLHPERIPRGDRSGARKHPEKLKRGDDHHARKTPEVMKRGEEHGMSKLTTESVLDIRKRAAAGEMTVAIAATHGITRGAVRKVVRRHLWKHV
jgi:hypothetical protein